MAFENYGDKSFTFSNAPHQFDVPKAAKHFGAKAGVGHRDRAKRLKERVLDLEQQTKEAWDRLRQFQEECNHPAADARVIIYSNTDDWAKTTWASTFLKCSLCEKSIQVPEDDKQSWLVSSW